MDSNYHYNAENNRRNRDQVYNHYNYDNSGEKETGSEIYVMDNTARRPGSAYR